MSELHQTETDQLAQVEEKGVQVHFGKENRLQMKFDLLARQWKRETSNCSNLAQRYAHPAYRKILALGPAAIPLVLIELKQRPDRWFSALADLTDYDGIGSQHSFDSAVEAWLKWGRENNYNV